MINPGLTSLNQQTHLSAKLSQPKTPPEILSSPIWHKTEICNETQYIPNWYFNSFAAELNFDVCCYKLN